VAQVYSYWWDMSTAGVSDLFYLGSGFSSKLSCKSVVLQWAVKCGQDENTGEKSSSTGCNVLDSDHLMRVPAPVVELHILQTLSSCLWSRDSDLHPLWPLSRTCGCNHDTFHRPLCFWRELEVCVHCTRMHQWETECHWKVRVLSQWTLQETWIVTQSTAPYSSRQTPMRARISVTMTWSLLLSLRVN